MYFTKTALLTFLSLNLALAAPSKDTSIRNKNLKVRDIGPGRTSCAGQPNAIVNSAASDYILFIDGDQQSDSGIGTTSDDCGHGFLDNLHAQCGLGVTHWSCTPTNGGFAIGFTVPVTCQGYQIQNSLWLATNPHIDNVGCGWYPAQDGFGPDEQIEIGVTVLQAILETFV